MSFILEFERFISSHADPNERSWTRHIMFPFGAKQTSTSGIQFIFKAYDDEHSLKDNWNQLKRFFFSIFYTAVYYLVQFSDFKKKITNLLV